MRGRWAWYPAFEIKLICSENIGTFMPKIVSSFNNSRLASSYSANPNREYEYYPNEENKYYLGPPTRSTCYICTWFERHFKSNFIHQLSLDKPAVQINELFSELGLRSSVKQQLLKKQF